MKQFLRLAVFCAALPLLGADRHAKDPKHGPNQNPGKNGPGPKQAARTPQYEPRVSATVRPSHPPNERPGVEQTGLQHPGALENVERLRQMPPDERLRNLSGLRPEQRARIEENIARLEQMDPKHREILLDRYRRFQALNPAQKEAVRQATRQLQELPEPRRQQVRMELNRLRNLPEQERQERLNSPDFQNRFDASERDIIAKESAILPDS